MFQFHQNILCINATALFRDISIMSEANYKALSRRNKINIVRSGGNGRTALVAWRSLPARFKDPIVETYGDPEAANRTSYLVRHIESDIKALEFYTNYKLDNGDSLPGDTIQKYTMNASILNAVQGTYVDRCAIRLKAGGSTRTVWSSVYNEYLDLDTSIYSHDLPKSLRRLKQRIKELKERGYESLIHSNYCNSNSVKLTDTAKNWLLARWGDRIQKCVSTRQLLKEYNNKAKEMSWKTIQSAQALKNYLFRSDIRPLWYAHRHGDSVSKEKFMYQFSTKLPSQRDALWYSDGTKLNYYYQTLDKNGKFKIATCNVYEVVDVYSEVLLGFNISPTEDYKAQYSAYKMAVQRSGHRPYQIGFDGQGGHNKLQSGNFLNKLAKLSIKTQPYNGRSKTIESVFNRLQQGYLKQDWFFTGMNITTKNLESKANMEFILANKYDLPTLEEVKRKYMQRREEWNAAPHPKTGEPRIKMYHKSTNVSAAKVELWDMVDLFWVTRNKAVRATAYGITFREQGVKYTYTVMQKNNIDLPDIKWMRDNIDRKYWIKYDPEDMGFICLYEKTPKGELRYVTRAEIKIEVHRAMQEHEPGEMEYMNEVQKLKKEARIESREEMDKVLRKEKRHVDDYGMTDTRLLGINSNTRKKGKKKKKKAPPSEIAKVQKIISNADPLDDEGEFKMDWRKEL